MLQLVASFTIVIYDHQVFNILATGLVFKVKAVPIEASSNAPLDQAPASITNVRQGSKSLRGTNIPAYFIVVSMTKKKSFTIVKDRANVINIF